MCCVTVLSIGVTVISLVSRPLSHSCECMLQDLKTSPRGMQHADVYFFMYQTDGEDSRRLMVKTQGQNAGHVYYLCGHDPLSKFF